MAYVVFWPFSSCGLLGTSRLYGQSHSWRRCAWDERAIRNRLGGEKLSSWEVHRRDLVLFWRLPMHLAGFQSLGWPGLQFSRPASSCSLSRVGGLIRCSPYYSRLIAGTFHISSSQDGFLNR